MLTPHSGNNDFMESKQKEKGRWWKRILDETKLRIVCYVATSNNEWIKCRRNEYMKEQTSLKRVAEEAMGKVNAQVEFNSGDITIGNESYMDWKVSWREGKAKSGTRSKASAKRD